jgi:hypothetical protein
VATESSAVRQGPVKSEPGSSRVAGIFYRHWLEALIIFAVVLLTAEILLTRFFPFSEKKVTESLQETFPSKLKIDHFRAIYFPRPGCEAEGVTFRSVSGAPGQPPLATIQKLIIQGNYANFLFRPHHISRVILQTLRVQVPAPGKDGEFKGGYTDTQTTIGELVANGAVLEIARANKPPLRFDLHEVNLGSVSARDGMSYKVRMQNPEPPGEIRSSGHFGPFKADNPGQTAVSGTYSFHRGDLDVFDGIAGTVESEGKFSGPLEYVDVQGTTDVPDFEVDRAGHKGHLATQFQGTLDGTSGDVILKNVNATYQNTKISVKGSVTDKERFDRKFTSLDFAVRAGRLQDILRLIVKESRPPMSGVISLQAHSTVPPEGQPFLKEVTLQGDFEISDGHFENPSRQLSVDELSETARGLKKSQRNDDKNGDKNNPTENVISRAHGHVDLRDGVATITNLSFTVPGADALMQGTFNVLDEKINLHGTMKMDAKFSQSTGGIKSLLAKVLDPFFNKKRGSVVPVVVDGTYHNPHFGIDLNPVKKAKN